MRSLFQISLLSIAAMAIDGLDPDLDDKRNFLNFMASHNRDYFVGNEFVFRLKTYQENSEEVRNLNRINKGVEFALGPSADLTHDEYMKRMTGVKRRLAEESEGPATELDLEEEDDGDDDDLFLRDGEDEEDYYINWVEQEKVYPVKDQGFCGSCWAFSAATAQEAMQSIKSGLPPVRLSEQEGLDCIKDSYGCGGGWMHHFFEWSMENGSQSEADYPYEARNRKCRRQDGKTIAS